MNNFKLHFLKTLNIVLIFAVSGFIIYAIVFLIISFSAAYKAVPEIKAIEFNLDEAAKLEILKR